MGSEMCIRDRRSTLENLQKIISELDELCDDRLNLLDFVSEITPVKEIKD